MYTLEQIMAAQAALSVTSHGEAVYTDISEAVNESSYKTRWFWELLQNAKDASQENRGIRAKLTVTDNYVEFTHSGAPFELNEILELIIQGSSKRESENKTGRFGTGFISTYVLSLQVTIRGYLTDGNHFDFVLNREAATSAEFLRLQAECTKEFHGSLSLKAFDPTEVYTTSFTYELSDTTRSIAADGIANLEYLLPYVLAFNETIDEVIVSNGEKETSYTKSKTKINKDAAGFISTPIEIGGKPGCIILTHEQPKATSAIRIDHDENGNSFIADSYRQKTDLFFAFPLLGSEELRLPLVINSEAFGIRKERYGIFLGQEPTATNENNRQIVADAIAVFPEFIDQCLKAGVEKLYNLVAVVKHGAVESLDHAWIMGLKQTLIDRLIEKQIIRPAAGDIKLTLQDVFIPEAADEPARRDLWRLYKQLCADNIPVENESEQWRDVIVGYRQIMNADRSVLALSDVATICEIIGSHGNRLSLSSKLSDNDELGFLNNLYILLGDDVQKYCSGYKIAINQDNDLIKVDSDVKRDEIEDEALKDILTLLKEKSRNILCIPGLDLPATVCGAYTRAECITKITGILSRKTEVDFSDNELFEANARLLKWLIGTDDETSISAFQVITSGPDKPGNTVRRKHIFGNTKTKKQKLLAPKNTWRERFPLYAGLVNDKDCLDERYTRWIEPEELSYLHDKGFLYTSPLIKRSDTLNKMQVRQLLRNAIVLDEEMEVQTDCIIEYTDFAFFVNDEDYVFASNSTPRSSLRILEFVLLEAIHVDADFDKIIEIDIDGAAQQAFYAMWLGRLKTSGWIYTRDLSAIGTAKYLSSPPSSSNLAQLINQSSELKPLLKDAKIVRLLSLLDISVADLIKNTLSSAEERNDWEKAFTALLISGIQPQLAETMLKDPKLQEVYRKQQETKKTIQRNQAIGGEVEATFRDLLEKEQLTDVGIEVIRAPYGSDYLLTPDTEDLINDEDEQEILKIGGWFIELKATGKQYASMTQLQAEKAVKNKLNYALIIVPLTGSAIDHSYVFEHGIVIADIGAKLEAKYLAAQKTGVLQKELTAPEPFVEVYIEATDMRYRVKKELWDTGSSISRFIKDKFTVKS